jgi:hypothetical protein
LATNLWLKIERSLKVDMGVNRMAQLCAWPRDVGLLETQLETQLSNHHQNLRFHGVAWEIFLSECEPHCHHCFGRWSLAFYAEIIGFQQIQRPNFDRHGAWLTMPNVKQCSIRSRFDRLSHCPGHQ